jgi:hypothetical protein
MDEINDYMEARELPIQLRYEIREFFFNSRMSAESKVANEGKILAELSAPRSRSQSTTACSTRCRSSLAPITTYSSSWR